MTKIKWIDNLHWPNETWAQAYRYCIESENVPELLQVTEQKNLDSLRYLHFCIHVTKMLMLRRSTSGSSSFFVYDLCWMYPGIHNGVSAYRMSICSVMKLCWKSFRTFKQCIPTDCNMTLSCCSSHWTGGTTQQLL